MPHKNRFHTMLVQYSLPYPTCHTRTGFIRCWYNTVYRTRHPTQEQFSYDVGTIQFTVPDMPHKNRFHMMLVQCSLPYPTCHTRTCRFHTMLVQYSLPYPTCHTRTDFIRCWYNTVYRTRHATQEQVSYDVGTIQFTVPDMPHKNSFHTMLVQLCWLAPVSTF